MAEQRAILDKALSYAKATVEKTPDFSATRTTMHFVGTPVATTRELHNTLLAGIGVYGTQRLIHSGTTSVTVAYRNGTRFFPIKKITEKSAIIQTPQVMVS